MITEIEAGLLQGHPERVLWPHKDWLRSRIEEAKGAWRAK